MTIIFAGRDLKHASGALYAFPFGEAFGEKTPTEGTEHQRR
ncbi:hypothetical protein [Mesorhizobium sp. 128a]